MRLKSSLSFDLKINYKYNTTEVSLCVRLLLDCSGNRGRLNAYDVVCICNRRNLNSAISLSFFLFYSIRCLQMEIRG